MKKTIQALAAAAALTCSGGEQIPVLGWHGIQTDQVSAARYEEARDMGFTALMQGAEDVAQARRFLDLAQGAGLKLMIDLGRSRIEKETEAVCAALKDHPALLMYHVTDEPFIKDFGWIADTVKRIHKADPKHPAYVNIINCVGKNPRYWYNGADTGTDSYPEFVKTFLDSVPVKMLSFDKYPVIAKKLFPKDAPLRTCEAGYTCKTNWYETLEPCYRECKARKIPLAAFAQSCAYRRAPDWDFAEPQTAHLLLQQNVNLAYGAQLLQYYVYWQTPSHESMPFSSKPPYLRTSVADRVRETNRQIAARSFVFLGCDVKRVRHTGAEIPTATTRLAPSDLPSFVKALETPDGGAVVSVIENKGLEYLCVVNRDPERELTLRVDLAPGVRRVRTDGTAVDAALYTGEYWLEPGAMEIFAQGK